MNILDFSRKKATQAKITLLTCYDYPSACLVSESEIDAVLVGDSVMMAVHGHENTLGATLEMMTLHTKAVAKGLTNQFLITDLPFLCHKASRHETVTNVRTLMQAGAHAIKIEGADDDTCETIAYLVKAGVPIMGHIGLTPQSIHQLGGHKVQGKQLAQQEQLLEQALKLEAAGCFAIVIECVPQTFGKTLTEALSIATIGIGAGSDTDGQILVWHDLLGLQTQFKPKFVKQFVESRSLLQEGIQRYVKEVKEKAFPSCEYVY